MNYRIWTNLDLSKVESNYDLNKNQYDNCEVDMFYRLRMEVWNCIEKIDILESLNFKFII